MPDAVDIGEPVTITVEAADDVGVESVTLTVNDVPVVLEVKTDPEVPPLPPHTTFEQARNFASMLVEVDPANPI